MREPSFHVLVLTYASSVEYLDLKKIVLLDWSSFFNLHALLSQGNRAFLLH